MDVEAICPKCDRAFTKTLRRQRLCFDCSAGLRRSETIVRRPRTKWATMIPRADFVTAFAEMKAELARQTTGIKNVHIAGTTEIPILRTKERN